MPPGPSHGMPAAAKCASMKFVSGSRAGNPCRATTGIRNEEKLMITITPATRRAIALALAIAFAAPFAANAAAPVHPVAPPPPGSNPYQPVVQNDVTGAYQFRTRVLVSPPTCQNYANQADAVFLSYSLDDKSKADQLKSIGNAANAAGCLAP